MYKDSHEIIPFKISGLYLFSRIVRATEQLTPIFIV
jgi:hypothetical protein